MREMFDYGEREIVKTVQVVLEANEMSKWPDDD